MCLQSSSKCSGWLNVFNFTRQRIPDRRNGMGKWPMSMCFGLYVHNAKTRVLESLIHFPHKNHENNFVHVLQHTKSVINWIRWENTFSYHFALSGIIVTLKEGQTNKSYYQCHTKLKDVGLIAAEKKNHFQCYNNVRVLPQPSRQSYSQPSLQSDRHQCFIWVH